MSTSNANRQIARAAGTVMFAILFGLPTEDGDRMDQWAASIALAFNPDMPPEHLARVEEAAGREEAEHAVERLVDPPQLAPLRRPRVERRRGG